MELVGRVVFRVADSNVTWFGLGWLRPQKDRRVSYRYVLLSSVVLGLPDVALGGAMIFIFVRHVDPVLWWSMFTLALAVELLLHLLFARFWNRRAEALLKAGLIA